MKFQLQHVNHLSLPISVEKWNPVKNIHKDFNDIQYCSETHASIIYTLYVKSVTDIQRFSIGFLKILSLSS